MVSRSASTQPEIIVWVLASGPVAFLENMDWVPRPNFVVAADGGSALAARLGVSLDLLIGDLDSADPVAVMGWEAAGTPVRRFEHTEKVETDTELALLAAMQWKPTSIYILGATGGRLDHELANILLLTHPQFAPLDVRVVSGSQEIFLAKPGRWNPLSGHSGDTVSLLPVGGDAEGVETQGLEYPLRHETLLQGRGRGVSNRMDSKKGQVWLDRGLLLVTHLYTMTEREIEGEIR